MSGAPLVSIPSIALFLVVFDPLRELVDCHKQMGETAPASSQWSNHIQPPNSERPDEWNGLERRSRLERLGMEHLAPFAVLD